MWILNGKKTLPTNLKTMLKNSVKTQSIGGNFLLQSQEEKFDLGKTGWTAVIRILQGVE
jgi:hypothetical protein